MMTKEELYQEFWLLTSGILQDSKVETVEALLDDEDDGD